MLKRRKAWEPAGGTRCQEACEAARPLRSGRQQAGRAQGSTPDASCTKPFCADQVRPCKGDLARACEPGAPERRNTARRAGGPGRLETQPPPGGWVNDAHDSLRSDGARVAAVKHLMKPQVTPASSEWARGGGEGRACAGWRCSSRGQLESGGRKWLTMQDRQHGSACGQAAGVQRSSKRVHGPGSQRGTQGENSVDPRCVQPAGGGESC